MPPLWLLALLVLLIALLAYGLLAPSPYRRKFPPDLRHPGRSNGVFRPREVIDPDEEQLIASIQGSISSDTERLPRHVGKDDPSFHEPHWGHSTGLLQGTLQIDDVEALPSPFRVGLFERTAAYPVVCRPNFIHDPKAKLAASRMAVKLRFPGDVPNVYAPGGTAHELDLLLAEGSAETNGPGHAFFARDARELALLGALKSPGSMLRTLLRIQNMGVLRQIVKRLRAITAYVHAPPATTTGWAGKHYFSAGPFALGEGAMKFCLRPRQTHPISPVDTRSSEAARDHRAAMQAWIEAGQDAGFDLCVQVATQECIPTPGPGDPPPDVMAAEYCDLQWDETRSPYVKVGTLTFPASPQADLSRTYPWSPLQFNAWNTLPSMRPLGQLFRARRHAHRAHCEVRLAHVYGAEPGAMVDRAPFAASAEARE